MMPSEIQRRAPFTPLPMKGNSTSTSSTSATANSQGAIFSQLRMGNWNATMAATRPMAMEMPWRITKWVWA